MAEYALILGSMLNSLTAAAKDLTGGNPAILYWIGGAVAVVILYGLIFSKR